MKINSENAKRQRMIVRRMKSGKTLVGLLAGLAVSSATSGCFYLPFGLAGDPENYKPRPADNHAVNEVGEDSVRDIGKVEKP